MDPNPKSESLRAIMTAKLRTEIELSHEAEKNKDPNLNIDNVLVRRDQCNEH
jgi:hypothetical protein